MSIKQFKVFPPPCLTNFLVFFSQEEKEEMAVSTQYHESKPKQEETLSSSKDVKYLVNYPGNRKQKDRLLNLKKT